MYFLMSQKRRPPTFDFARGMTISVASDIKPGFSFVSNGSIRHYFPSHGDEREQRLAPLHGILTLPRISPDCPHCVWLWLDRSIIVGWRGRRTAVCQNRLPGMVMRSPPYLAVTWWSFHSTGVSWRIPGIAFPFGSVS